MATTTIDPTERRRSRLSGLLRRKKGAHERTIGLTGGRSLTISEVDDISPRAAFWHGASSMRMSIGSSSGFEFWCERHVSHDPWIVVGHFLSDALERVVAGDPSLPALPDDLYSEPKSTPEGRSLEFRSST